MPSHEIKICPCCKSAFECKVGSITTCHCSSISLSVEEQGLLEQSFSDCLCHDCLTSFQNNCRHGKGKNQAG